jgi:hypothetical protein
MQFCTKEEQTSVILMVVTQQRDPLAWTLPRIELRTFLHSKKAFRYSRPQPGSHLPNAPYRLPQLFPPRESLVSDIPAGDGNIEKLFLRCNARQVR